MNGSVKFKETQRFNQWWLWGILLAISATCWYGFIKQIINGQPFGTNPAPDWMMWILLVIFGIGFPVMFLLIRLTTTIENGIILIKLIPFKTWKIEIKDIVKHYVCEYKPFREFGGWGVRWSPSNGMAYSASGNRGVQLELSNSKKVLIGSQIPEQLDNALN